jgi:hypothetical protein
MNVRNFVNLIAPAALGQFHTSTRGKSLAKGNEGAAKV